MQKKNYKKIAIIVKTDLKYDGRVLNHLKIVSTIYKNASIRLLYLADGPDLPSVESNVKINKINLFTRGLPKTTLFQIIKNIEFALRSLFSLNVFKPELVYVHDEMAILGPLIFKKFHSKIPLIYDDHELKHFDIKISLREKIEKYLEKLIFQSSDAIVVANFQRKDLLIKNLPQINKKKIFVVENWVSDELAPNEKKIKLPKNQEKILLHQGVINQNRCDSLLADLSILLPKNWKIGILGIEKEVFNNFLIKYQLDPLKFIFIGKVKYSQISGIWNSVDAGIIFYETSKINNRFCAPNRLFLAANFGKPLIVNKNPVLIDFINQHNSGVLFEKKIKTQKFFNQFDAIAINAKKTKGKFSFTDQKDIIFEIMEGL